MRSPGGGLSGSGNGSRNATGNAENTQTLLYKHTHIYRCIIVI